MQENTFRMAISCLMYSFMWCEIGFLWCYFSLHSPIFTQGLSRSSNQLPAIVFFSPHTVSPPVRQACMTETKSAIQFPFFDGKRHLTIKHLSEPVKTDCSDTNKGILHSSERFGRRSRDVETDSAHKTPIH